VARNIENRAALDELLERLTSAAGVDGALVLSGDRDHPTGTFLSSLELIETDLFQQHGIKQIAVGCYPEGHPNSTAELDAARTAKLAVAERAGLDVTLVSQFCSEAPPIIALAERMRAQGVAAPFRVGHRRSRQPDAADQIRHDLRGRPIHAVPEEQAGTGQGCDDGRNARGLAAGRRHPTAANSRTRHFRGPLLHLRQPREVRRMG
jgi:hypothetical protein